LDAGTGTTDGSAVGSARMNAETRNIAPPVDDARLSEYFRDVESFQIHKARTARRWGRVAWVVAGASMAVNLTLAVTIAGMLPLHKLVPVFITVHSDGTTTSTTQFSDLPANEKQAAIRAAIWQYVRNRESYDFSDAQYRYDVTSLMSDPTVLRDYQNAFLDKNPDTTSPQVKVGQKGQINVSMISMEFVQPHVVLVRYSRTLLMYGIAPETSTWTATIGFQIVSTLPVTARLHDPSGLIVTNYQASKDTP
jgi:type IV secretion system protein VirB8